jgi:hypothetical protein
MEWSSGIIRSIIVDSFIISHYKYQLDSPQPGIAYLYIHSPTGRGTKTTSTSTSTSIGLRLSKSHFIVSSQNLDQSYSRTRPTVINR